MEKRLVLSERSIVVTEIKKGKKKKEKKEKTEDQVFGYWILYLSHSLE